MFTDIFILLNPNSKLVVPFFVLITLLASPPSLNGTLSDMITVALSGL